MLTNDHIVNAILPNIKPYVFYNLFNILSYKFNYSFNSKKLSSGGLR